MVPSPLVSVSGPEEEELDELLEVSPVLLELDELSPVDDVSGG
jgi:hypothetical protein